MKIAIGCDHTAIDLKKIIIKHLESLNIEVVDFGTNEAVRTDYPIYAARVARAIQKNEVEKGILICGTGIGISIAANKFRGIRAVACSEPYSAKLSVEHNNTNVLAFGARVVGDELAKYIVDAWLGAQYEAGRHQRRLDQIAEYETEQRSK